MKANYHTHTWRCMHAKGTEREYVENAIESGLEIMGFSDHAPMPFDGDYRSTFRMEMDQFEDYVTTVLNLRQEYRNEIEIHLGVEAEYYPKYFDKLDAFLHQYPVEYRLLGQHFLGNEKNDYYCGIPTLKESHLKRYCEQTTEAMRTGQFTYLAHPDLIHYIGRKTVYEKYMYRLCQDARELNIPLEINCLGILDGRHYPNERFWEIAGETGNTVIIGLDAHEPEHIVNRAALRGAQQLIQKNHLTVVEQLNLSHAEEK